MSLKLQTILVELEVRRTALKMLDPSVRGVSNKPTRRFLDQTRSQVFRQRKFHNPSAAGQKAKLIKDLVIASKTPESVD